ncbi:hypothetical protein B0T22DRAFT_304095 [Podospora appendiculata]|uniref:Uncharacterized protein n=1 Tax=Podospora appendiculata TaxID=314037 RepID=A0AAE0WZG3_9PEZI|nr:hypothetical protein B0T22DRAFT_304095 [Podospora appendiculata]
MTRVWGKPSGHGSWYRIAFVVWVCDTILGGVRVAYRRMGESIHISDGVPRWLRDGRKRCVDPAQWQVLALGPPRGTSASSPIEAATVWLRDSEALTCTSSARSPGEERADLYKTPRVSRDCGWTRTGEGNLLLPSPKAVEGLGILAPRRFLTRVSLQG